MANKKEGLTYIIIAVAGVSLDPKKFGNKVFLICLTKAIRRLREGSVIQDGSIVDFKNRLFDFRVQGVEE